MPRFILLFVLLFALPIGACTSREFEAIPVSLNDRVGPGDIYGNLRLLGALRLIATEIDGLRLCGLSGLAWDEDAGLLYAISDRGALFHLRPIFDERGYLSGARALAGHPLRDASGNPVRSSFSDAEGLAIRNGDNGIPDDAELLVSFEVKPRVVRYNTAGQWRGEEPLPVTLRNARNYRDSNQALEAVTIDPRWGILVGSETPLRNDPPGLIRIFATRGRFWLYPLGNAPGSALVAMEALPDGGLLTLERAFVSPLRPFVISLRRTKLSAPSKLLPVSDVAVFNTDQGWLLDNFEGLTRHREQRFFMISDDNCNGLQTTLLVYFELLSFQPESGKR
jgi:hypothetical protein